MKIIDIHTHGGFGINFNNALLSEVNKFVELTGLAAFCPTLATDSIINIKKQLEVFSSCNSKKIIGVHLEGIFLNPDKSGIQNKNFFLTPTIENFKRVVGDFENIIKIVTLAPELDIDSKLSKYLISKNIKVQAGHTLASELYYSNATTHHFNAMAPISHRGSNITTKALLDDDIYCEIIADGIHIGLDMLKIFFRTKNNSKIILISDSLPIAHSNLNEFMFCNHLIYANGKNKQGKLAGSVMFLEDIVKFLINNNILDTKSVEKMVWDNPINYLGLDMGVINE